MSAPTVASAYARLGVSPALVARVAQITPTLRRLASVIRRQHQNIPKDPIFYLRASADGDAKRVLEVRASLPKTLQSLLPIEAFCVAAGVDTLHILDVIQSTILRMGGQFSSMLAAVAHPSVVEKSIEMALTDEGIDDRMALHRATGFIPTAKGGPSIHIPVNVSANAGATANAAAISPSAPSPEHTIRRLSERLHALRAPTSQHALPESTATEIPAADVAPTRDLVMAPVEDEPGDAY